MSQDNHKGYRTGQDRHMGLPLPRRRSIRLKDYDYSGPGAYSVTICTHNRKLLLANPTVKMMIQNVWTKLADKFVTVSLDEFVIMPNRIHGIIFITDRNTNGLGQTHGSAPTRIDKQNLGRIIQWFKTLTTNHYVKSVKTGGWKPFSGRLWQRNYYEHIIRNEKSLYKIREYIRNNPDTWDDDIENPTNKRTLKLSRDYYHGIFKL